MKLDFAQLRAKYFESQDVLAHDPKPPSQNKAALSKPGTQAPTDLDTSSIKLPARFALDDGSEITIPEGSRPFPPMTDKMRTKLRDWRTSSDKEFQRAMLRKGQEMAIATLLDVKPYSVTETAPDQKEKQKTETPQKPPKEDERDQCKPCSGGLTGSAEIGLTRRDESQNDDPKEDGPEEGPLDHFGKWIQEHVADMSFELIALVSLKSSRPVWIRHGTQIIELTQCSFTRTGRSYSPVPSRGLFKD